MVIAKHRARGSYSCDSCLLSSPVALHDVSTAAMGANPGDTFGRSKSLHFSTPLSRGRRLAVPSRSCDMLYCGGRCAEAIITASFGRLHAMCACDGSKVVGNFKIHIEVFARTRAHMFA